ncbi:gas vesicle protein GvpG [Nonomuraea sp. SYSU D8015]|uniref:gas vesicle protein GvpG n=1 Tax=Nonomuraea sp. SYSU D8015 TaxID=2593644 RepID=UPI00166094B0|nr:gas vesicle protein GvpG [Nonomuraea sp. SYSU D8015]
MGLFYVLFGWPIATVKGVVRLGELIQEQAERETYDPVRVRHRLEEIERLQADGAISKEDAVREMELISRQMIGGSGSAGVGGAADGHERG